MSLVNFMRQTVTKSCLRTVKPLHFAKFEKLYPVIFLVKYIKFFIINVGLQILLTQLLPLLLFGTNWRLSKIKNDLLIRSQTLYPTELRSHICHRSRC